MITTISLTDCLPSLTLHPVASSSRTASVLSPRFVPAWLLRPPSPSSVIRRKETQAPPSFDIKEDETHDHQRQRQSSQPGASLEDRSALGRRHPPLLPERRRTTARLRAHRAHSRAHGRRAPLAVAARRSLPERVGRPHRQSSRAASRRWPTSHLSKRLASRRRRQRCRTNVSRSEPLSRRQRPQRSAQVEPSSRARRPNPYAEGKNG